MLRNGDILGEYRVVARIGAGGMGAVFIAQRTGAHGFARPVAIKVVDPRLSDNPRMLALFVREALLASRVDHPNVARVEQLCEFEGAHLLVMEYVHGGSVGQLSRALGERRRRLAPELAVAIALQAADGLHAAHEARDEAGEPLGLVHRDVSPQNILVSRTGHVKLIDFGVAKAASSAQDHTQTGVLRGKVRYMSPEQAYGDAVDRRADVYALGVVLWELLTMRPAFHAQNDFKLLDLVRQPALLPPSHFAPDVPRALDEAVMAALAPDRAQRVPTAHALRQRLAAALPAARAVEAATLGGVVAALIEDEALGLDDASLREQLGTPATGAVALADEDRARVLGELTRATEFGGAFDDAGDDAPVPPAPRAAVKSAGRSWRTLAAALPAVALIALGAQYAWTHRATSSAAIARPAEPAARVNAGSIGVEIPRADASARIHVAAPEATDGGAIAAPGIVASARHRHHHGAHAHAATGVANGLPFAHAPGY